jgi:hypothetical protein
MALSVSVSSALALALSDALEDEDIVLFIKAPEREYKIEEFVLCDADYKPFAKDAVDRVKHNPRHPRNNNGANITRGGYRR